MYLSIGFAVLLLIVVAIRYLMPRKELCPGCGTAREHGSPLCTECGWIFESDEDEADGDDVDQETELSAFS